MSEAIIGAAIAVHRELGPGLLESVYEACLDYELRERGLRVERQRLQDLRYKRLTVDAAYRIDLVVEDGPAVVLVELKAVEKLLPIHEAQLITHLKLSGCRLGLLINFNSRCSERGSGDASMTSPTTPSARPPRPLRLRGDFRSPSAAQ